MRLITSLTALAVLTGVGAIRYACMATNLLQAEKQIPEHYIGMGLALLVGCGLFTFCAICAILEHINKDIDQTM